MIFQNYYFYFLLLVRSKRLVIPKHIVSLCFSCYFKKEENQTNRQNICNRVLSFPGKVSLKTNQKH